MKICPKCGNSVEDNATYCRFCGLSMGPNPNMNPNPNQNPMNGGMPPMGGQMPPQQMYQPQPQYDPTDHTAEFSREDISDNKVLAMMPYLSGVIGIIIALLAINHSKYVAFHIKQALKLQVVSILLAIITVLLCWTVIVPFAGAICSIIIFVVKIICFVNVCKGKAKEPPIISGFNFLK